MEGAAEKLDVHVVVVRDRTARSAIFTFDCGLSIALRIFHSPDTTAKAFSDAAVLNTGL